MAGRGGELRSFAQDARHVVIASVLVGLATGLVVAGCDWLTVNVLLDWLRGLPLWLMAIGPCVGLLLAALSLRYLSNRASAGLADTWLQRFHDPDHDMNVREAPGGVLASIVTIGFGGALGLEGLSMYAGGAIGTAVQQRFRRLFHPVDAKLLMTAGAAAGVAAIFKAPATGALFALEVPYRNDFATRKLIPALVAAASGYIVYAAFYGTTPLFPVLGHPGFDATTLLGAVALGLIAGIGARLFAAGLREAKRLRDRLPVIPRIIVAGAALGGLFVLGRLLTGRSLMLGPGYDCITWALDPHRAIPAVLALLVLRCLATIVTTGGGGAGGLFIPLVIGGALLGRAFGGVVHELNDTLFLVLGMSAFLGAGYRVPLAGVMFVAETTGRATFVVPALIAAVAADLVMGNASVTAYQLAHRPSTGP
jgi:CIC family chloride channel protein